MAQRPTVFGAKPKRQAQPEAPPAPRKMALESQLCDAIADRVCVLICYEQEAFEREYEPAAVYWSERGRVLVSGVQVRNGGNPTEKSRPHNFEVGLIRSLTVTKIKFVPDPRFDRRNPKYARGIICSV
jgi:hypothetical protein